MPEDELDADVVPRSDGLLDLESEVVVVGYGFEVRFGAVFAVVDGDLEEAWDDLGDVLLLGVFLFVELDALVLRLGHLSSRSRAPSGSLRTWSSAR